MALDISNVFYLAFRLGPFLVVSYFLFQSVLNWELRGIIYLCGLLLAALLAYLCNGPVNTLFPADVSHIFAPAPSATSYLWAKTGDCSPRSR
jgi:hypothetical protein